MEGRRLSVKHKQYWGRGFILLLPHLAALSGSDADSDGIKPTSGFVIKNHQITYSSSCRMQAMRHAEMWSAVCTMAPPHNPVKERDPIVHGQMELPDISPQAIDLNPSCSEQAHSNRPGISHGYKSTKP